MCGNRRRHIVFVRVHNNGVSESTLIVVVIWRKRVKKNFILTSFCWYEWYRSAACMFFTEAIFVVLFLTFRMQNILPKNFSLEIRRLWTQQSWICDLKLRTTHSNVSYFRIWLCNLFIVYRLLLKIWLIVVAMVTGFTFIYVPLKTRCQKPRRY